MAAQKGVSVVVNIDTTGLGVFAAVGGARTNSLSFNNQGVDATSAASTGQWREMIDSAGILSMDLSVSGVFQDDAQDAIVETAALGRTITDFQFVVPDFGTFEGPYLITNLSFSGSHDGAATFDLQVQSAGQITFTAA